MTSGIRSLGNSQARVAESGSGSFELLGRLEVTLFTALGAEIESSGFRLDRIGASFRDLDFPFWAYDAEDFL